MSDEGKAALEAAEDAVRERLLRDDSCLRCNGICRYEPCACARWAAEAAIKAYLEKLRGWRIAPLKPTEEMRRAGKKAETVDRQNWFGVWQQMWRADVNQPPPGLEDDSHD